jgi:hypothetical protein
MLRNAQRAACLVAPNKRATPASLTACAGRHAEPDGRSLHAPRRPLVAYGISVRERVRCSNCWIWLHGTSTAGD